MKTGMRIDYLAIGLLCIGAAVRAAGFPFVSEDTANALIPWYEDLIRNGFSSLATFRGTYSPPYVYLLWLASLVFGPQQALLAIKAVGVVCDLGLCAAVAGLCSRVNRDANSLRTFALLWCVPTVVINSSVWGQCDGLYTLFLVAFVTAVANDKPWLAFSLFGIALSIKLQAMFIAPFIGLLLLTRRLPWLAVPASIICFVGMLAPAAFAGRPWAEVLTIYARQVTTFHDLALSAPNLWSVAKHIGPIQAHYELSVAIGFGITVVAGIGYLVIGIHESFKSRAGWLLEAVFVSAFIFPFLLPKLHDRYFFPADVFSVALALTDRRWLKIAALVQIGSLTAYTGFLLQLRWPLAIGVLCNTIVFVAILVRWYPLSAQRLPLRLRQFFVELSPPMSA